MTALLLILLTINILTELVDLRSRDNLPEWNHLIYGHSSYRCYNIPSNFTLCNNIGYQKMILPNFLQHESIAEATSSSKDWQTLTEFNCHIDTRRFLCSLYAPVCVPNEPVRKIHPCRELCMSVKKACSAPMLTYGYRWPDILHCDKFPRKYASLCIGGTEGKGQQVANSNKNSVCNCQSIFSQNDVNTKYCRATTVLKAKISRLVSQKFSKYSIKLHRKSKIIKSRISDLPHLKIIGLPCLCNELSQETTKKIRKGRWLLMGEVKDNVFLLTSLIRWRRNDRILKRSIRRMRRQEKRVCGFQFHQSDAAMKGLNILGQKLKKNKRKRRKRKRRRQQQINGGNINY